MIQRLVPRTQNYQIYQIINYKLILSGHDDTQDF